MISRSMIFGSIMCGAFALSLTANPAHATTLTDDLLPDIGAGTLIAPGGIGQFDLPAIGILTEAKRNFAEAIDLLETGLETRADYASILALAPELRIFETQDARLLWLHAIALAASGALDEADATLSQVPADAAPAQSPLPFLAKAMLDLRRGQADLAATGVRDALERAPDNAYSHNLLGTIAAGSGDLGSAAQSFARATELAPGSVVFWRNLGIVWFRQDRIQTASAALQKALEIDPGDCTALVAAAQIREAFQKPAEAEDLVRQCLRTGSGDVGAVAGYFVSLQVAQNEFDEALASIDAHAEDLPDPHLLKAEIALFQGRPDRALTELEAADSTPLRDLRRWLALAMAGDPQAALEAARAGGDRSIESAFTEIALSTAVGRPPTAEALRTARGDPDLAAPLAWFEALAAASTKGPEAASGMASAADGMIPGVRFEGLPGSDWTSMTDPAVREHMALGVMWLLRDFAQPASAEFAEALQVTSLHQARYFKALAEVILGRDDAALDTLTPTTAALPGYYSAQVLSGELRLKAGDLDEALTNYRNAAQAVPDGGALMRVGVLADMLDQPDVAEAALRQFIELFPDSMIGYNQLSWVLVQREVRLDEALRLARRADELQPGNAGVLDNIGWITFLKGDVPAAHEYLLEANRRAGGQNPDILYHLAEVEAAIGARDESRHLLRGLFEIAPADHAAVRKGQELLTRLE